MFCGCYEYETNKQTLEKPENQITRVLVVEPNKIEKNCWLDLRDVKTTNWYFVYVYKNHGLLLPQSRYYLSNNIEKPII